MPLSKNHWELDTADGHAVMCKDDHDPSYACDLHRMVVYIDEVSGSKVVQD